MIYMFWRRPREMPNAMIRALANARARLSQPIASIHGAGFVPRHAQRPASIPARPLPADEQQLVERFVRARKRNDVPALAALPREDVTLCVLSELFEFHGRATMAMGTAVVVRHHSGARRGSSGRGSG